MEKMDYVNSLNGLHFGFDNSDCIVKKRIKGLNEKPPLYIWNLTKACYVSSLKLQETDNDFYRFYFDVKKKGTTDKDLFSLSFDRHTSKIEYVLVS